MAKWSKQKYKISTCLGLNEKEVEGVVNNIWGIDKRENQYYILTHIPTGCFVESARTQKFLKDLVEEPEFREYESLFGGNDVSALLRAINRQRNIYGWDK